MAQYPNLVAPIDAFAAQVLSSPVPAATAQSQQIPLQSSLGWFEVDINGAVTTNKLGQSGPFVLQIGSEKILCSTLIAGAALVYQDETTDGRAYLGTSIAAHSPGASVTLIETSVQSYATANVQHTTSPITSPIVAKTGAYAMTGLESVVLATGAVTLPAPALFTGVRFSIKDTGGGTASVLPHASETIDGASSQSLTAYESVTAISDGTNWWLI